MYSVPMYTNIPGRPLEYASTILACLAVLVTIPIYIVYKKGPAIRAKSKFALSLEKGWEERRKSIGTRTASMGGGLGAKEGLPMRDEEKGEGSTSGEKEHREEL
jgi:hypothetical protein